MHVRSFCLLTFALPPLAALALPTAVHAAPAVHGREAEQVAGVKKLKGGLWHPYRRKWAIERKHLPLVDVGETGSRAGVVASAQGGNDSRNGSSGRKNKQAPHH
jgi:hypothetical protein